jgi:hypothetical protein
MQLRSVKTLSMNVVDRNSLNYTKFYSYSLQFNQHPCGDKTFITHEKILIQQKSHWRYPKSTKVRHFN